MTWLLRFLAGRVVPLLACTGVVAACYSAGDGSAPPPNSLYFPVGLDVSPGGNVLYVANSDFDLQFNGGTIQSYDLNAIRQDVLRAIIDPTDPNLPLVRPGFAPGDPAANPCPGDPPVYRTDGSGIRQPLGETCAPPVNSQAYVRDSVTIGAFATDLQVLQCEKPPVTNDDRYAREESCNFAGTRLYVPVRGDASVTWADITPDTAATIPQPVGFKLDCGQALNAGHCGTDHSAGNNAEESAQNSRLLTMPGEPFGMAIGQDGQSLTVTHQTDTKVSLLTTGFLPDAEVVHPALEYVLDGLPTGGVGLVNVPHDRALTCPDGSCVTPRPAFLWTSRNVAEMHLLRYYSDDGSVPLTEAGAPMSTGGQPTNPRPFLLDEAKIVITANAVGTDSRGVVIDRTPRLACKARVRKSVMPTDPTFAAQMQACAQTPARVFVANRAPASVLIGTVGAVSADGSYDADSVTLFGNIPLSAGPSKLFLAPIVDQDGDYALRLFIVCFDSATLFIYDPDAQQVESVFRVAPGPFSMAFDPFNMEDVAERLPVPPDSRITGQGLLQYRFAYLASFTESFIQVIDLDNSRADKSTFEVPVFTLGSPTLPKGTN